MVMCDSGKSGISRILSGYGTGALPSFCAVGSGSGAVSVNNTGLVAEVLVGSRAGITGSADVSTLKEVAYVFDFDSIKMSGVNLREFGVYSIVSGGQLFSREGFTAVTFDSTNEAQITVTYEIW